MAGFLTGEMKLYIVKFFTDYKDILIFEHYDHGFSPLDDLDRYMAEEENEGYHSNSIELGYDHYSLSKWMDEEINEYNIRFVNQVRNF